MEQTSLKDWLVRLFFLLLCGFMINRLFFFSPGIAEVTTSYLLYPIITSQKILTDPVQQYLASQKNRTVLQQEIIDLQQRNQDLQANIIALHATIDFEQRSQQAREYEKKYEVLEKKLVQVLMRSFDDQGHFYWIDAGLRDDVTTNMIAVYKNNIVGRVIHVDPCYSKIALITDKRCKIAVSCAQTKSVGIYEGNNSFTPSLEFVPHYEKLVVGDIVMSTGQGLVYPQGFAVGSIMQFDVQDVAYQVKIQPLIDLQRLDFVYLITS